MGTIYQFGRCELDVDRRELRRDGRPVALERKVFQVLHELVRHADGVVTKHDLLDRVWPGTTVNEVAIARCISTARRAIADAAGDAIKTVHGLGYRFVLPVNAVGGAPAGAMEPRAAPAPAVPERKQVSVLCAILDGARPPAIDLDDRHGLMLALEKHAEGAAQRHGGTVLDVTDGGLQIVFGAPAALEDHAARALLAALDLTEAASVDPILGGALRVGIDAGATIVRPRAGNRALSLVGDVVPGAVALAARAPRGVILTSATVAAGARDAALLVAFDGDDVAAPRTYRVEDRSADLPDVPGPARPLSRHRLVGRVAELRTLRMGYDDVQRGKGRLVVVMGEAGIGKSRLVAEFLASLPPTHVNILASGCQSYGQSTPLLPLRSLLLSLMRVGEGTKRAPLALALDRLLARIAIVSETSREALRHLLGVADPAAAPVSPAVLRMRMFGALHDVIAQLCRRRTTILVIEDLHWMDATSQAFLATLAERAVALRLLLVATQRPGSRQAWIDALSVTRITLGPLSPQEGTRIAAAMWSQAGAARAMPAALVTRSGGNPFFLEELVKAALEPGAARAIPDSVQAVVATRVDQLPAAAKRLLQAAAAIGGDVALELLRPLAGNDDIAFEAMLGALADGEFLLVSPDAVDPTVVFKHALLRDVAYQSMITRERQRLHATIANTLEAHFAQRVESQPELIAHHRAAAGEALAAIVAWDRAAELAVARSAFTEALSHLRQALDGLAGVADPQLHKRWELRLHATLGTTLTVLRGFTDPEGEAALEVARRLCAEVSDVAEVSRVLRHLWPVHFARARYALAIELSEALLRNATAANDDGHICSAYAGLGATAFFRGELATARSRLEAAVMHGLRKGGVRSMDFLVFAQSYLGRTLWLLGEPDAAIAACAQAERTAMASRHPWLLVQALYFSGLVRQYGGDTAGTAALAERMHGIATENEFRYWILLGEMLRAWSASSSGDAGGIGRIEVTLDGLSRMGTNIGRPYFLGLLADARQRHGRTEAALQALDEAVAVAEGTGERNWLAEHHRLRGDLLAQRAAEADRAGRAKLRGVARESLIRAVGVAEAQGALGFLSRARSALAQFDGPPIAPPVVRRKSE